MRVSCHQLRMAFGGAEVVKGVDLELRPGEVHAIVGENGAGKSTVAKLIAGVYKPTGGRIDLDGRVVQFANPREAIDGGVALIHQEPLTFPDLEVAENIFVGHQPGSAGVDWRAMRHIAKELLARLGVDIALEAHVGSLSVADQQMVELAFALSQNAQVFLFDETTASLTPSEVAKLFDVVRTLKGNGAAIAFVSHRLDEVLEIADRITIMRDGSKVAELSPRETSVQEIIRHMVGRDFETPVREGKKARQPEPVLSVRRLSNSLLKNITFDLYPGEILGVAGLVGAGRTNVARALFGIEKADGDIHIAGKRVSLLTPRNAIELGIALVPEDRQHEGLLMPCSIVDNATLPSLKGVVTKPKQEEQIAESAVARMKLVYRSLRQAVSELSGGNQQKVALAKWLLANPRILILDEPTRGVDVGAKAEVHGRIRELAAEGMAILMISSDLQEVLLMSDRILVMREGSVVAELDGMTATSEAVMAAATGQVAA